MAEKIPCTSHCPHCGAPLPEAASFCPYCARSVRFRAQITPPCPIPRRWRRALLAMVVLAATAAACFALSRPKIYDARGEVHYTLDGSDYQLVLAQPENPYEPTGTVYHDAAVDEPYRFPVLLYIHHADSGADAGQLFLRQVARVEAFFVPVEGLGEVSCTAPAPDNYAPDAALVSYVDCISRGNFTTQMVWVLTLENGDVIRLRQDLSVTAIRTYDYYPEDAPMDTLADLQALVDEIAESTEPEAVVNIHLPPVTYAGSLVMEQRPVNLLGSSDGLRRTTFTETLRVASRGSWITYLQDLDFIGSGQEQVGVSASARLWVEGCTFQGWKTGMLGYGDAWVNAIACTFRDNLVGFHFNSEGSSANHTMYNDNLFSQNGTAVLLENVPTNLTLNFYHSVFSGNDTDIDNRCGQPLDISQAVFQ